VGAVVGFSLSSSMADFLRPKITLRGLVAPRAGFSMEASIGDFFVVGIVEGIYSSQTSDKGLRVALWGSNGDRMEQIQHE
jgi:hypothetical protein